MRFEPTTVEDVPQIKSWIALDEFHHEQDALFYLGGTNTIVAVRLMDADGVVLYLRADVEGPAVRLHVQFGPVEQVSKLRTARALMKAVPAFADAVKKSLVTESVSPSLIKFLQRVGFQTVEGTDDYAYKIAEERGKIKENSFVPRPWTRKQQEDWNRVTRKQNPEHEPIAWAKRLSAEQACPANGTSNPSHFSLSE
jgi:hypothetical protein